MKPILVIMMLATLTMLGAAPRARAQQTYPITRSGEPSAPSQRVVRRRIEITPRPLLYRRCVDWYELQYRPSGTVLYPQMRCWWVRG